LDFEPFSFTQQRPRRLTIDLIFLAQQIGETVAVISLEPF